MAVNDRRLRANRANAARSTGPRTEAGKAAARLNALRHGLAAASHSEPGADQEIELLARAIAGAESGSELLALARRIADAELGLRRVQSAQMALETPPLESLRADLSRGIYGASCNVFEAGALDRYERRARSRRKFAIRDYDAARAALPPRQRSIEDQPSEEIANAVQHDKCVLSSFWQNEPNLASGSDDRGIAAASFVGGDGGMCFAGVGEPSTSTTAGVY